MSEVTLLPKRGSIEAAVLSERVRCIRDACCYCDGRCPQYGRTPLGPNEAANWTHRGDGYADPKPTALCTASSILNRAKFQDEIALTIWALGLGE